MFNNFGIRMVLSGFMQLFDNNFNTPENAGAEAGRAAGETLKIISATNSKEKIDKENARKFRQDWFSRFIRAFRLSFKESMKNDDDAI
jgi:hypothetical protein